MVGALANGFSQVGDANTIAYYDQKAVLAILGSSSSSTCRSTCTPAIRCRRTRRYTKDTAGCMGPTWAFGQETAVHALRLMGSGLFDRYPEAANHSRAHGRKPALRHVAHRQPQRLDRTPHNYPAKKKIGHYFHEQFPPHHVRQLPHASAARHDDRVGADRIMFSTDWPFENIDHAANWFDAATISETDRAQDWPKQRNQTLQTEKN